MSQRVLLSLTKSTLKTYCYIIFFILKGHFCPSQQKTRGAAAPSAPPPSSGVPAHSTEEQERSVTTLANFGQSVCTPSTKEEKRSVTTLANFGHSICTPSTEEVETIDRLIQEVSQNRDTIFNIELTKYWTRFMTYSFFYYIFKITLITE